MKIVREGFAAEGIHFVGNIMIDTVVRLVPQAALRDALLKPHLFILLEELLKMSRPSVRAAVQAGE